MNHGAEIQDRGMSKYEVTLPYIDLGNTHNNYIDTCG